ncbi:MAG: sigma 54-interacting transcriptional regulator [Tissierellia bacterium]|nr:sigma 54-interacting transcriptional regulator [Tissierellia bacterium]
MNLVIVSWTEETGQLYQNIIAGVFEKRINLTYTTVYENYDYRKADLILASTYEVYEALVRDLAIEKEILIAELTLPLSAIETLERELKIDRAMVANTSIQMAIDTITDLEEAGFSSIKLFPYYPGTEMNQELSVAITPDEESIIPEYIHKTINIGHRVLSYRTIFQIAIKLDLVRSLESASAKNYFNTIFIKISELNEYLSKISLLEGGMRLLSDRVEHSILLANREGQIISSHLAASMGNATQEISEMIGAASWNDLQNSMVPILKLDLRWGGVDYCYDLFPVFHQKTKVGYLIYLLPKVLDGDISKEQKRLKSLGHYAKYSFADILTDNRAMLELIDRLRLMACSKSSVLLIGETGTGKELIAQAIHNASARRERPFLAINCAAITPSLLESELFGYEEGAFSGARRGGKIGFFQLADEGTLFLDEIGELDITLQTRLLRVLQEKSIIKVGGETVIDVDVRIISATNKDLFQLVQDGRFRKDLYYRLNTLEARVPSLRERPQDISLLFQHFQKNLQTEYSLSEDAQNILLEHDWDGNVRELENLVERLVYYNKENIEKEDLLEAISYKKKFLIEPKENESLLELISNDSMLSYEVVSNILYIVSNAKKQSQNIGRKGILEELSMLGIHYTENEIRRVLSSMRILGLIDIKSGRGGTRITGKAEELINSIGGI